MTDITAAALTAHPFLRGMSPVHLAELAGAASRVTLPAGHRVFEPGGHAGEFWLIESGHVAVDLHVPGEGLLVVDTVGIGGILGCSWLIPPYQWAFGAVCAGPVQAFRFDAAVVLERCAADPALGYELTRRVIRVIAGRLQSTRGRLLSRPTGAVAAHGPE